MNKQEIFDKAYIGIIKQGKPSMTPLGTCKYETKDGSRCAVGMLIDEAELRKSMDSFEPSGISDIIHKVTDEDGDSVSDLKLPAWIINENELLTDIQGAHDFAGRDILEDKERSEFLPEFTERMKKIALNYGLNVPEVN